MDKVCGRCENWLSNTSDCGSSLCDADMYSDDPSQWFVKCEADHECHRPEDFAELED